MATAATTEDKKPTKTATAKTVAKSAAKPRAAKSEPAAKAATPKAKPAAAKATATKVAKRATKPAGKSPGKSSKSGAKHDDHVERVWELAKRIGVAMFVTWDGEEQRARPLAAHVDKDEGAVYFLTDVHGQKDDQVAEFPHVSVSFADHKHAKYVALSGKATVSNDREKIKDLWSPFAKAWWDSPEDPAIRVIKLVPNDAELWDSPGRIVTTISMLAAAVTGRSPKIGENAKVTL